MARSPKGTIIQPLASWNLRRMNGASGSSGPLGTGGLGAVGLQNSCTNGEWMVVWDVQIVCLPNPIKNQLVISDICISTGRALGSLLISPDYGPLTSQAPATAGDIWTHNAAGEELGTIFNSVTLIPSGAAAYYQWVHEWPVCAIKPGDSVVAYSDGNPYFDFGVGYIYEIVPGGI